ncbi:MAG: NAD-dependent epimerase/dehydratase family protein [bacterium]
MAPDSGRKSRRARGGIGLGQPLQTALVTGACGFIGSHLVDQLAAEGWDVRATDLPSASRTHLPPAVPFVPSDLTAPETLGPALTGVEVLFHVAALFDFSASWERLFRTNVLGTDHLLAAARKAGVRRVVSWSSYAVYGKFDARRLPIDETHPIRPKDAYGRSKAMQDAVVWRHHEEGLPATIVRPSAPYGPRARYGMADLFRRLDLLPVVPVPRNLGNRVVSVHVRDVVRAASQVARSEACQGQEYNLTDDGRHSTASFMALAASALGKRTVPVLFPEALLRTAAWAAALGSTAAARTLGWRPLLEQDTIYYLTYDFVASNEKVKSLGFRFLYPDPRDGIPEVVRALRAEGFLRS